MAVNTFGVMLDSARALENRAFYRRSVDFLAQRGVNTLLWHFTDDQGCAMHFDCAPAAASPHAYSKQEMRELVLYARCRGVEIVPEVETLGHTVYLTRLPQYQHLAESTEMFSSICPVDPQTRPLIQALIEEAATVFDGPAFHAGLDETNFGHNPLTAAALRTRSKTDLFADHIHFVHGVLAGLKRRMWMWADGLLHDIALAPRLPHDIVMCNWRYRPQESTDTTQYLLDQGFDVVLCSASISSGQMLFPGERYALPNVRSLQRHVTLQATVPHGGTIVGQINTVWTPVRYIADSLWLGLDLILGMMHDATPANLAPRIGQFGTQFYGLTDTAAFEKACLLVLELSPLREQWLAVLAQRPTSELPAAMAASIRTDAPRWDDALRLLRDDVRRKVRLHADDFTAFLLMVRVATYAFTTAAGRPEFTEDELERAVQSGEGLLAELEARWDTERFADDPRKFAAPIHHFDGDHLIPRFRDGIDHLRAALAAQPQKAASQP